MKIHLKLFFLSLVFLAAYGCDFNSNEKNTISENISWHRNIDGVFYGKTCIDNHLFVVSSASHQFKTLSGIIGSCTGNEPSNVWAEKIDESFEWSRSSSGISYFYTCIEDHVFIVSPAASRTKMLSLISNDCSKLNDYRMKKI